MTLFIVYLQIVELHYYYFFNLKRLNRLCLRFLFFQQVIIIFLCLNDINTKYIFTTAKLNFFFL